MNRSLLLLALGIVLGTASCNTTNITQVSSGTGKIEGNVQLVEMDCSSSLSSANITVQLVGTSISAQTDSSGNFTLENVPAGYYYFLFSKPDYATMVAGAYEFVGGGIFRLGNQVWRLGRIKNWVTTLSLPSFIKYIDANGDSAFSFGFSSNSHEIDSNGNDHFSIYGKQLYSYVGKHPNISYQDPTSYFSSSENGWPSLHSPDVHSKDTIYMISYPLSCNYSGYNTYYVGDSLKTLPLVVGPPSNVLKIVLP